MYAKWNNTILMIRGIFISNYQKVSYNKCGFSGLSGTLGKITSITIRILSSYLTTTSYNNVHHIIDILQNNRDYKLVYSMKSQPFLFLSQSILAIIRLMCKGSYEWVYKGMINHQMSKQKTIHRPIHLLKLVGCTIPRFEDAWTKRWSSRIGCKLRKMAKTCPCLHFSHCVFQCLLHMLSSVY